MKASKQDLINLQLNRTDESLAMAKLAADANYWNSAAGELYYTFFYLIRVLFTVDDIDAQTHKGVKMQFAQSFIKTHRLHEKWGTTFSRLFDYRQEGSYGNFKLSADKIAPLLAEAEEFKKVVLTLLEESGYKSNNQS